MESYFKSVSKPIQSINVSSKSKYFEIVEQVYTDDSIEMKTKRDMYCHEINSWLNTKHCENKNETNGYVCEKMFNDILEIIDQGGFKIHDLNQFKEDLIHYMYILSNKE